ncbi:MAG: N-acetylmuramoyl-L-alanine amidase [Acidimicrobiales bacterium]
MTPPPPPPDGDRSRRDVLRLLGAAAAGAAAGTVAPAIAALPGASAETTTTPPPTSSSSTPATSPPAATPPPGATIEHRPAPTGRRPTSGTSTPAGTTTSGEQALAPFVLIGFTVTGVGAKPDAAYRVLAADGWTPWSALEFDHADTVSEPVWVGSATGYEVRVPAGATTTAHLARDGGPPPGTQERRAPQVGPGPQPAILLRSSWGARPPARPIEYANTTLLGVVHHTVSSNVYAAADVPAILRSIQAYHIDVEGWDDIGYQFLADRYGRLWEGRYGGIDLPVIGAQAKGFNLDAFGVSGIGEFTSGAPTTVMISAMADLMAWRLGLYGIAADGRTTITSSGNEYFAAGQVVDFPAIVGHRDTRPTECPGDQLYAAIPTIRAWARARQPAVGPTRGARTSPGPVAVNRDGRLEAFGIAAGGGVQNCFQYEIGSGWSGWYPVSGSAGFPTANRIQVVPANDGHLEAYLLGPANQVVRAVQGPIGTGWSAFTGLGGTFTSPPAVARNADGRIEIFGIGTDGGLYHAWQQRPDGPWSSWFPFVGTFAGAPGVGATADGRLVVAAVGTDGQLRLAAQNQPNGAWTPMLPLGGVGGAGRPAIGRHADGRLEVVVRSTTGRLLHTTQAGFAWTPLVERSPGTLISDPALASNADGRLEAFGIGTDHEMYRLRQSGPNSSTWGPWAPMGGSLATPPSVIANPDGRLEVFSVGTDGKLWHDFQLTPSGAWFGMTTLGGSLVA